MKRSEYCCGLWRKNKCGGVAVSSVESAWSRGGVCGAVECVDVWAVFRFVKLRSFCPCGVVTRWELRGRNVLDEVLGHAAFIYTTIVITS